MVSNTKNVLFAISDTGGGHRSAATALMAALSSQNHMKCTLEDFLKATGVPVLRSAPEIYDYCSRKQLWLNNLFFTKTNSVKRIGLMTRFVFSKAFLRIERELDRINPALVVSTHPLVTGLLVAGRKDRRAVWPIVTVVTDLVTIHASWATPGADLYLVPTEEAYQSLIRYGIAGSQIVITGFPVHPKFSCNQLTRAEARRALGVDPNRFSVLLTGGGVGAGNMAKWIKEIEKNCHDKQIMVVAGHNKELFDQLQSVKSRFDSLQVYGFVDNMEVLMAASDIIISKAGPGTIMEAAAMSRPLIITEAVGIQESGNIHYVVNNQLGYFCSDPSEGTHIINNLAERGFDDSNVRRPPNDGSLRITSIIERLIASSPENNNGIFLNTALFRGA
ncbi:monogalactosyldiacylglycerol (mgdg) synthase [Lucifera butyrica]|uniref:Monogalactosyldiacylglycerol (Mgdg) synthase n=1 Tax=Lucifera butyrica TaxID=1351585 RepID=A0A498RBJ5_9FIRM|nr:glycosyltransferase [Lucifera butyrica]VBB08277.1 monogalactosyldiacylglycerol (mgdg) synthase [Lucifera butyrica]